MVRHLDAVYEQGVLRPLEPLALPEHQHVWLTVEETPSEEKRAKLSWRSGEPVNERRAEMQWLAEHSSPHAGEWVAVEGSRLVAHGKKLVDVSAAATEAGVNEPLFASIPEGPDIPFGGW